MALLELQNVRVEIPLRRQTLVALDDVSLHVEEGEVLGVVGESGAGKSLTVDAIIGLVEPPGRITHGEVLLAGRRIDNLPDEALQRIRGAQIGVVFQDPMSSLNPLYSIGYQLVQTIRAHLDVDLAAARRRAIELLAEVGIPDPDRRLSFYPHQFSGGMRQRVVIALALCAGPRVIIADEPTTALDVSTQAQILDLLRRLSRQHRTAVVLISHDMGVIAEMADRVAVMYAGRIVETGAVQTLIDRPQHPYTQGLMSSIPRIDQDVDRLAQVDGAMPRLADIPAGCAFHPRCPKFFDRCRRERPDLRPAGFSHEAACWLFDTPNANE
jgi:peptide/nickel transport system ATP-binding protein